MTSQGPSIIIMIFWKVSHISTNECHLAIESRYGKNNPIFSETSKKKGQAVLKLSHSTKRHSDKKRASRYSDLSTNSRSSLNNTFSIKKQLTPKKWNASKNKLKWYWIDSEKRVSRSHSRRSSKRKLSNIELLNNKATNLVEKSVYKPLFQMTPNRTMNARRNYDMTGYMTDQPKLRVKVKSGSKARHKPAPAPMNRSRSVKKRVLVPSKRRAQPRSYSSSFHNSVSNFMKAPMHINTATL